MHEWLSDYKKLIEEIAYLEFNLDKTKRELARWENPNDLGKYKLEVGSHGAQVEEKIEAIEYELAHKINDLRKLEELINSFDGLDYKILYKKHVEGKTLRIVAAELGYSEAYIKKVHSEIMKTIKYASKVAFSKVAFRKL